MWRNNYVFATFCVCWIKILPIFFRVRHRHLVNNTFSPMSDNETKISLFWWNWYHWLSCNRSKQQLRVQSVTKISSKWVVKQPYGLEIDISHDSIDHDDVIKCRHSPCYWLYGRGIHRSPVNSPHKGQWRGALMFSLICVWINSLVNYREAGDLRRYCAHYDVTVMCLRYDRNKHRYNKQCSQFMGYTA